MDESRSPEPASGPIATPDGTPPSAGHRRLHGVEAAKIHGTLLAVLALCSLAFRFELARALGGNGLSWAYVFEWPLFAAFGLYMWWTLLYSGRGTPRDGRKVTIRRAPDNLDPKYAGMLDAWQAHQRNLQAAQAEAEGRDVPGPTPPA